MTPPLQSSEWLDDILVALKINYEQVTKGQEPEYGTVDVYGAKAAILKKFEEAQLKARIDEVWRNMEGAHPMSETTTKGIARLKALKAELKELESPHQQIKEEK